MMKNRIFTTIISAYCLIAVQGQASEITLYDCGDGEFTARVKTVIEEKNAQIAYPLGVFQAPEVVKGKWQNLEKELQFITTDNKPTLWIGSEQLSCRVKFSTQNHETGAVGGGEIIYENQVGKSLGGKLRDGPGINFARIGSLPHGRKVIIEANTGVEFNGYDWFAIYTNGKTAYQWGGIMCSASAKIDGIYEKC